MQEDEVIELAKKLNVKMPYRLKELFEKNDPKIKSEILQLKDKLYLKLGMEEIEKMSGNELLNFAFKHNPEIVNLRNNHNKNRPKKNK